MNAIRVTRRYSAPPARVFDAWLDPEMAGLWLFATANRPMTRVAIDARVEGSFRFVERRDGDEVEHTGEYIEIVRPRRLAFTLRVGNIPRVITRVVTEIVTLKRGCELRLVHENVPPDHTARTEARWTGILYGLELTLENPVRLKRKDPKPAIRGTGGMRACMSISGPAERL